VTTPDRPWHAERLAPGVADEGAARLCASLDPPGPFDPVEEAARPHGRVWLARGDRGGPPCGVLVAWRVADELEILFVATDPRHRRRGVARALLGRAIVAARDEGAARLVLEVASGNAAARALYASFGFEEVGVRRGYYADGDDAVMMARAADAPAPRVSCPSRP
jgi:ribosomal protein S18 acetylase RimI-like enzyme